MERSNQDCVQLGKTLSSASLTALSSLKNPILEYVKILMTLFLIGVHLKLKFFNEKEFENNSKYLIFLILSN